MQPTKQFERCEQEPPEGIAFRGNLSTLNAFRCHHTRKAFEAFLEALRASYGAFPDDEPKRKKQSCMRIPNTQNIT